MSLIFVSKSFILFCFFSVEWEELFYENKASKFEIHTKMSSRIGVLRIFPGITQEAVSIKILNLCFMFLIFFFAVLTRYTIYDATIFAILTLLTLHTFLSSFLLFQVQGNNIIKVKF